MRRVLPLLALLAIAAAGQSCKTPTQIVVEARTNVQFRPGISTAFTVGGSGQTEHGFPTAETDAPWEGSLIGTLVVVPGTSEDAAVAVKVVMGIATDPVDCRPPEYLGCIVARRRLRYSPNELLRLPIALYSACQGVPCDESTTCNALGACVSADVDPGTCETASGCTIRGDDGTVSGVDASVDATPGDGASDAPSADASTDAAAFDAGNDGSSGDGGLPTPNSIDCRGMPCMGAGHCCYDTATDVGICAQATAACTVGGTIVDIRCDDDSDCTSSGGICCYEPGEPSFRCRPAGQCVARVCHVTQVCASCTGKIDGYYSYCQ